MSKAEEELRYIKAPVVARRFGVHVRTIWDWVYRGLIPHHRIGRNVFFIWEEVEKTMNENRYIGYERVPLEAMTKVNGELVPRQMDMDFMDKPESPKFRRTW